MVGGAGARRGVARIFDEYAYDEHTGSRLPHTSLDDRCFQAVGRGFGNRYLF